ncbi:MAG: hypothetical protein K2Y27_17830 [Xanthobacteraceae bacterium]|nr:hypothetical protein [Xanthobacteraceae bacterium]
MSRIAVATALACTVVFASGDADARARLRMSSPSPKPAAASPKPAAAAPMAKPLAGQTARPGSPAAEPKPFAAAKPANPQPVGGGTFVVLGGGARPGSANAQGAPPQRAMGDDASGPLRFDPTLAVMDDKGAASDTAAAAKPATECLTTPQTVVAKEPLVAKEPAKDQIAASEARKIEAAPPSTNPALVPVRPKRQAPVVATVCYVQRDGSCVPSY